jgi:hypothetical protein
VIVPHADILLWPTVEIELVPGQGVGFSILPTFVLFQLNKTAAYTNINGAAGIAVASDVLNSYIQFLVAGVTVFNTNYLLTGTVPRLTWLGPDAQNAYDNTNSNMPLIAQFNNAGSGNLTGGAAADVMTITTFYDVVAIP